MKIPEYHEINPMEECIANPILKAILEYRKYVSVTITENLNIRTHFRFTFVSVDELLKEIKNLNPHKAAQSTDVHLKDLKDSADIFAGYVYFWI